MKVHFIGIGGVGMSALAQMLVARGDTVSGSDREAGPITEMLEGKEIRVAICHNAENAQEDTDVVVYSDAVSEDNPERARATELGIRQLSYFEMLGEVSRSMKTIAVAGTHGKTTTTGMLTKILVDAGVNPTAIIGSIVKDFESNYVSGRDNLLVVEACEYRDHLLELSPEILVITNLEWDHTDYFPSLSALQTTFQKAIDRVPSDSAIITDPDNPTIAPLLSHTNVRVIDYTRETVYELQLPGEFNQMNARAAAAAARVVAPSITNEQIAASLADFRGTWRRFEYKGKTKNGAQVYDDYAHHPTAVRATLCAARKKAGEGQLIVAFHPHLYSRTRDLLDDFAKAFNYADKVYIAPIYPAREVDDGSISNEILAEHIRAYGVDATAASFEEIKTALSDVSAGNLIITMGAGDIYKVADKLVAYS